MSDFNNLPAGTLCDEVATPEQLNTSGNEQNNNAPVDNQNPVKKGKKEKKPRDQWSNPRAGYPQQYLCAAISDSSRKLLPSMTDEELSQAQDALEKLNEMFSPFFTARAQAISAARAARSERLAEEAKIKQDLQAAREASKAANAKLKALKAAKKATA
jgi:hypothetical protein